jgi:hypothetical protein
MKRRHILLIILIFFSIWLLSWILSPKNDLALLVIDKTVPESDYREHRAIYWIAEHRHFSKPDGTFYRYDEDFLGYHPETGKKEILTSSDLEALDLLYLADSYGIYDYEEGLQQYEAQLPFEHQDIELIFGGFSLDEVEVIEQFAARENKYIIGEHNIFGYPTYTDPEASSRLQAVFAVNYSGWLARYYSDLNEAAFWLKELYEIIYGHEWDLGGPGMVFIGEEAPAMNWQRDLVIVTADQFNNPWPVIAIEEHSLNKGASNHVPYLYWVEVLEALPEANVLAYYELPLEEEAYTALARRGLPRRFPAVISYTPPGAATRFYFAGDFADQLPALLSPRLTGSVSFQRFMSYLPGLPVEYRFYFQWYEPVLNNILNDAVGDQ